MMPTNLDSLNQYLAASPYAAVLCGVSRKIIWANDTAGELLSIPAQDLVGMNLEDLLNGPGARAREGVYRHTISSAHGERVWLERAVSKVETDDGDAFLNLLSDISGFDKRRRARVAVLSGLESTRLDSETGVLKRQAVLQELTAEISRSRRYSNPLSVAMVRFSDCGPGESETIEFKGTREAVAQCVNETLRWVDSVGSLGPGQLLIVLPETNRQSVEQVGRKLEAACAALTLPARGAKLHAVVTYTLWSKELDVDTVIAKLAGRDAAVAA